MLGLHEVAKMPKRAIQVGRDFFFKNIKLKPVKLKALCCVSMSSLTSIWLCGSVWVENSS